MLLKDLYLCRPKPELFEYDVSGERFLTHSKDDPEHEYIDTGESSTDDEIHAYLVRLCEYNNEHSIAEVIASNNMLRHELITLLKYDCLIKKPLYV